MASKSSSTPAPLTFDLELPLIEKIEDCRRTLGLRSTSEVVRLAITRFNFDRFRADNAEHRQISVRLTGDLRTMLRKQAKAKRSSVGELLRVAIENLNCTPKSASEGKKATKAKKR